MAKVRPCKRRFLVVNDAPHVEDAALGNKALIMLCARCESGYYAVPSAEYDELRETDGAKVKTCLSGNQTLLALNL